MPRLPVVAAALLAVLAGCAQPAFRDPPPLLADESIAIAGDAAAGHEGCEATLEGTDAFTLCGVRFTQAQGRFTVASVEGPASMRWSHLRVRAASANLVVAGDENASATDLTGDVDLGRVNDGRLVAEQSVLVCRTFDASGPATLMFWDARPHGATVQATYRIDPCTQIPGLESAAPARERQQVRLERDLDVSQQFTPISTGTTGGPNCISVPEELAPWSGNATATWVAQAPTAEQLVLGVGDGYTLTDGVQGPSVLSLTIPEQRAAGFIGVSPPNPGATQMQAVRLAIELTVTAEAGSDASSHIGLSTCRFSF